MPRLEGEYTTPIPYVLLTIGVLAIATLALEYAGIINFIPNFGN